MTKLFSLFNDVCDQSMQHSFQSVQGTVLQKNNKKMLYIACLVSLAGAATSIIFVATKVCLPRQNFCCDKIVCRDKTFDATNCDKIMFVATKRLTRQEYFCRDKTRVLSRQIRICRNKSKLVAKKTFVTTKLCLSLLSRQKL